MNFLFCEFVGAITGYISKQSFVTLLSFCTVIVQVTNDHNVRSDDKNRLTKHKLLFRNQENTFNHTFDCCNWIKNLNWITIISLLFVSKNQQNYKENHKFKCISLLLCYNDFADNLIFPMQYNHICTINCLDCQNNKVLLSVLLISSCSVIQARLHCQILNHYRVS